MARATALDGLMTGPSRGARRPNVIGSRLSSGGIPSRDRPGRSSESISDHALSESSGRSVSVRGSTSPVPARRGSGSSGRFARPRSRPPTALPFGLYRASRSPLRRNETSFLARRSPDRRRVGFRSHPPPLRSCDHNPRGSHPSRRAPPASPRYSIPSCHTLAIVSYRPRSSAIESALVLALSGVDCQSVGPRSGDQR